MMNNFELAVAYLLLLDPVANKRTSGNKRGQGVIYESSGIEKVEVSAVEGAKPSRGKTGVEFRFYKKKDYDKLTCAQKDKLCGFWKDRDSGPSNKAEDKQKGKGGESGKAGNPKVIAAAVTQQITAMKQEGRPEDQECV